VLFLQAAAEDLPTELQGIANEIHVNFPWGSLLRGVATGDAVILNSLRRICSSKAQLKVTIGLDLERDRSEMERLQLPQLSVDYINAVLVSRYKNAGFKIDKTETLAPLEWPELQTSWAKRLKGSPSRSLIRIVAEAV
jgi:16S rRNA (adenine(1408)-N(1))-methyltransferase